MSNKQTTTEKIDAVIKRHFNMYFKEQYIEPNENEWSALRRAMKKLLKNEREDMKTSQQSNEIIMMDEMKASQQEEIKQLKEGIKELIDYDEYSHDEILTQIEQLLNK